MAQADDEFLKHILQEKGYEEYEPVLEAYAREQEERLRAACCDVPARCRLAWAYLELRRNAADCVAVLEAGLEQPCPDDADLRTGIGYFHAVEMGEKDTARACLSQAVALAPKTFHAYLGLGLMMAENEEYLEAARLFALGEAYGGAAVCRRNRATALYLAGEHAASFELFTDLAREFPKDNHILLGLGAAAFRCGREEEAASAARTVAARLGSWGDPDEHAVAALCYVCGLYALYVGVFDAAGVQYEPGAWWLDRYYFSLHALGETEKLAKRHKKFLASMRRFLRRVEKDPDPEPWGKEKPVLLAELRREIEAVVAAYEAAGQGRAPEADISGILSFEEGCWLPHCIRHG